MSNNYYKNKVYKYDYYKYLNEMMYVCGKTVKELCADLGVGVSTMNRIRHGCIRISLPTAITICVKTGIMFSAWAENSTYIAELKRIYDMQLEAGMIERIPGVY